MFTKIFKSNKPIIGMLHLPPLPGSPGWSGDFAELEKWVSSDVVSLVDGGVHGILVENFGDIPFAKTKVSPLTVSAMTRVIQNCVQDLDIPFGINVLRNDWDSALSIAAVTGAVFIRVNILTGAYMTDQGLIEGEAYACMRRRSALESEIGRKVLIFADAHTKHGKPLIKHSLADTTRDLTERIGVDGVIISGERTGESTKLDDVATASKVAGSVPILVGSGVGLDNLREYSKYAQGFFVGTFLKRAGKIKNPVDIMRVKQLVKALDKL